MTGSISHVLVQLPHVFQRLEAENLASVIDARYLSLPSPIRRLGVTERDLAAAYEFRIRFHVDFTDNRLPNDMRSLNPVILTEEEPEAWRGPSSPS